MTLVHTRMAVIDLLGGRQPMAADESEDPAVTLTYCGEIYNAAELRSDLAGRGHRFRTRSDTEVVLRAYLEWGERCPERLEGMFAFAVWDARTRSLFLARDRFGVLGRAGTVLVAESGQFAQLVDVRLERGRGAGRRMFLPELFDELVQRDRGVGPQGEQRETCRTFGADGVTCTPSWTTCRDPTNPICSTGPPVGLRHSSSVRPDALRERAGDYLTSA